MRHSRASTTMEIYAQTVPQSQRVALEKLAQLAHAESLSHLSQ
jgi:hypothetical protein